MKDIIRKLDFLQPEVDIEHKGELFGNSIFSLIISIIAILFMIYSIIYFFMPVFKREDPSTNIFHSYIIEEGSIPINYSEFPHYPFDE